MTWTVGLLITVLLAAAWGGASSAWAAGEPSAPSKPASSPAPETTPVKIKGKTFALEVALDDSVRVKGLGGREKIAEDGGMVFVFARPFKQEFVMRDCPIAIDIAFLDGAGRVLAMHEMTPEEPRKAGESAEAYESRLKRYGSRFPSQFVVEVAGGTLRRLGLEVGDLIVLDTEGLKARAR